MLLVDVVGPETRRCRSAWQCVYLVPIDAVDFPTIQKIMLELHKLASFAPSEAFVLVLVNYVHLKVSQHVDEEAARKAWTAFFFKMQGKAGTQNSHSWRVLGVAPEGVAVVSLDIPRSASEVRRRGSGNWHNLGANAHKRKLTSEARLYAYRGADAGRFNYVWCSALWRSNLNTEQSKALFEQIEQMKMMWSLLVLPSCSLPLPSLLPPSHLPPPPVPPQY